MKGISFSRGVRISSGNDAEEPSTDDGGVRYQEKVDPKSLSLNYKLRGKDREVKPLSISGRFEAQKASRFSKYKRDNSKLEVQTMNSRNNRRESSDSQFERRRGSTSNFKTNIPPLYAVDTAGLSRPDRQAVYFNSVKVYPAAGYGGFYKTYFIDVVLPYIKQKIFKNVNFQFTVSNDLLLNYFVDMSMALQALYCYEVIQDGLKSKYTSISSVSDVLVTSSLNNEARKLRNAMEGRVYPKLCNEFLHWMFQPYLLEDVPNSTIVMNSYGFFWTVNVTNFSPLELDRNTLLSVSTFKDILLRINDDKYAQLRGVLDASFPEWHLTVLKPCQPRYDVNFNNYWRNSSVAKCQTDVAHSSDGLNPPSDKLFYVSKGTPDGALLALLSTNTGTTPLQEECGLVQYLPPNTPHLIGYPETVGKADDDSIVPYVEGTLPTKTISRWYLTKESGNVVSKMVNELPQILGSGCAYNTSTESSTFRDINQVPGGYNVSTDLTVNMLSENTYMLIDHLWEIPKA